MADDDPVPSPDIPVEGRQIPFADLLNNIKGKLDQLTEDRAMSADLLFMTTYMASLALANASRPRSSPLQPTVRSTFQPSISIRWTPMSRNGVTVILNR